MRDVADRAGVAISSVSRVLSGHPDVAENTREKVLQAAASLGYSPDLLAQGLRTGETMTIGFVVGDISNPLLSQIARGAEVALREAGRAMLLTNSFNTAATDREHIQLLSQRRVDGLILSLSDDTDPDTAAMIADLDVPCVLVDRQIDGVDTAAVLSDHAPGMTEAFEYLRSRGHTRIGLVNGFPNVRPARERARILSELAQGSGVSVVAEAGAFTADHGYRATIDLLSRPDRPSAIVAGSNQILVGALRATRDLGLTSGTDLELVTCDDIPLSEFLVPPLPTVSRDPEAMGAASARLLLHLLAGGEPTTITLPTSLRAGGDPRGIPADRMD